MARKQGTPANDPAISAASFLFGNGNSGQWATKQLKAAAMSGKALSASALRTLDTLRHEEWKFFDQALLEEAKIRLVGVADLMTAGLVRPVPNALGKTVFGYEKITDMDEATISLDGRARTTNDKQEFELSQIPLPITHKDFFLNLRQLAASRNTGEPLDTTQVRTAGRVVSERAEKMLFQGGPVFGGLPIYGYMTHPDRITSVTFDGGKDWGDATKTGPSYLNDLLDALTALSANRMHGPFWVYVPTDAGVVLDNDYVPTAGTNSTGTIRNRLAAVNSVAAIRVADQLPSGNVIIVQATSDVTTWVNGEGLQTIQWDEGGGFTINFKAFQIGVPLIRSDAANRSGVCHLT